MKRATLLIFALLLLLPMFTFAEQDAGYGVKSAYGDWNVMGAWVYLDRPIKALRPQ